MATSVHIPPKTLAALDRRAKALGVSRNKLIVQAIERELGGAPRGWPPGFIEWLVDVDDDVRAAAAEIEPHLRRRSSKPPPRL